MKKMYFLTLYNISPIQQGIQSGHCVVEYALKYGKNKDYLEWAKEDKTFIVLNGGTSKTLLRHLDFIKKLGIKYATFQEPDLGGITTCICFLGEEKTDITNYFTKLFKLA